MLPVAHESWLPENLLQAFLSFFFFFNLGNEKSLTITEYNTLFFIRLSDWLVPFQAGMIAVRIHQIWKMDHLWSRFSDACLNL